ncbi:MAG: HAMP domain-containing histidine kinase [Acidobacteria bacterium]|nr:HAMP domain-containing histidine kinase [Acidobacteriota bacterium]
MDLRFIPLERELSDRLHWFIRLRWFAIAGLTMFSVVGPLLIQGLSTVLLLSIAGVILLYNLLFLVLEKRWNVTYLIHCQVLLDWLALTVLCHQTGGIDSPFVLFFVFHVILISMLTNRRGCFAQGFMSIVLICIMIVVEKTGLFPIPEIPGFNIAAHYERTDYLLLYILSFAGVVMFTIYLTTSIVQQLRQREEKLITLQQNLSRSYQELVELDAAKSRFVRTVAHEIRSPMAATQSLLRVALDGFAGDINEKVRDLLVRSERRIIQLLDLVNELLDLVRGGQTLPEEDKSDINVYEAISRILSHMEGRAEEKNIHLKFRMPDTQVIFRGDEQDLERIFQNLVGNAIKYTPPKGYVKVIGRLRRDNFLLFKVCDTGIGIPEKEVPRVFDEFFRASNAKRSQRNGTGLGLSIVKKTIEKYGGQIKLHSKEGKGSCFSVYLPVIVLKDEPPLKGYRS